ncbi:short chain dehydrogenase/reductase family protein [Aspergillus heteromorphus CBS 117.55]|uniref:Short chain dehydrogenase/reductase family protein n=1 Tax=Aspergillus heteromorphus CBS 117.55 TaxID=1448321 RepID=A0A317VRG7_9EURO|nr:short chain dehydrogenase/reductase family protein [Aspergillus heteromorphus CBS 117.55]PWY76984.1 short chain dehydrogenase/reductase family protein [Aspergillus heteromorphus CBS 117.55]
MSDKVILCTGANQGLGFAIIQVAALRHPNHTYILCSRGLNAGQQAVQKLRDLGLTAKIDLVQLDVTNDQQIIELVDHVTTTYGRLDVLINNAGIIRVPSPDDLSAARAAYNDILNVNITSVAVVTTAFTPLLYKSAAPKVINISSGLGSIQNTLTKKMGRTPPYGASKVGLNGLTVHMQVAENDRIEAEGTSGNGKPRIRYYACAPGLLKTAFTNYWDNGRSPEDGAEVAVQLLGDDEDTYEGGSYWQFVDGEMKVVPW